MIRAGIDLRQSMLGLRAKSNIEATGTGGSRAGRGKIRLAHLAKLIYDAHHKEHAAMKRSPRTSKEATHKRIVVTAARVIRRSGYSGTGVAGTWLSNARRAAALNHLTRAGD